MNFKEIITFAVQNNFSELFLSIGSKPSLRINKEIIEIENLPVLNSVMIENLLLEIISQNQINTIKEKEHLDFHYKIADLCSLKIFISFSKKHSFVKIINISEKNQNLNDLNLPSSIKSFVSKTQGLFIISGEKYDGKTTTLNAIIQEINENQKNLICIYQEENLIQTKSNQSMILNIEDEEIEEISPDILVIDEIKNLNQLKHVNKILEEGKKVIISINANSVIQTIQNLANIDESITKKILTQHLQTICNISLLKSKIDNKIYPISEVLISNSNNKMFSNLDYHQIQNLIETGKDQGMHTKKQDTNALQNLGIN